MPAFTRRIDAPFVGRAAELTRLCERVRASSRHTFVRARHDHRRAGDRQVETRARARNVGLRTKRESSSDGAFPTAKASRTGPSPRSCTSSPDLEPRAGLERLLADEPDGALAVERVLAAIGATDEAARTEEIFWAVRVLLERLAREQPVVAVLDDIHWAEPTLLDLIEYVASFARGPVLVACTARPDLFEAHPHWAGRRRSSWTPSPTRTQPTSSMRSWANPTLPPAVRRQITERAEGNPLFVEQMLALAGDNGSEELAVPATIQALLAARLDHLPSEERAVLVRGAVEGRLFHRGAVSALLPEEDRDGRYRPPADAGPQGVRASRRVPLRRGRRLSFRPHPRPRRRLRSRARRSCARNCTSASPAGSRTRADDQLLRARGDRRLSPRAELTGTGRRLGYVDDTAQDLAASEPASVWRRRGSARSIGGDHRAGANLLERAFDLFPQGDHRRLELVPNARVLTHRRRQAGGGKAPLLRHCRGSARTGGFETLALTCEIELKRTQAAGRPQLVGCRGACARRESGARFRSSG